MPKTSVIIPTYNRREPLRRAVASVVSQAFRDIELVIVNDGSTDGTEEYLSTVRAANVRCLNLDANRGGAGARNEGIRLAKGEYVAFLDDDDAWEPLKLAEQVDRLERTGADLCRTGITMYSKEGKFIRYIYSRPAFGGSLRSIMHNNFIGTTSSVMVRRTLAEKVGGFDVDLPALQDWDFYIRLFAAGCREEGIDRPLVRYHLFDESKNVSYDFTKHKAAAERMKLKYKDSPFSSVLARGLFLTTLKKSLKSREFLLGMLRYCARAMCSTARGSGF